MRLGFFRLLIVTGLAGLLCLLVEPVPGQTYEFDNVGKIRNSFVDRRENAKWEIKRKVGTKVSVGIENLPKLYANSPDWPLKEATFTLILNIYGEKYTYAVPLDPGSLQASIPSKTLVALVKSKQPKNWTGFDRLARIQADVVYESAQNHERTTKTYFAEWLYQGQPIKIISLPFIKLFNPSIIKLIVVD